MKGKLRIGPAHSCKGESDLLTKVTHEIMIKDRVIGQVSITLYDFVKASKINTAWKWISGKGTYLNKFQDYLFDSAYVTPVLPRVIAEESEQSNDIVIIDEILLDHNFTSRRLESYILSDILEMYLSNREIIFVPDYSELSETMGYERELSSVMYSQLGFIFVDSHLAIKFKSAGIDDLDEIEELILNESDFLIN